LEINFKGYEMSKGIIGTELVETINNVEVRFNIVDTKFSVSSLDISKVFGKEHKHVIEKIEKIGRFEKLLGEEAFYKDKRGQMRKAYQLTLDEAITLASNFRVNTKNRGEFLKVLNELRGDKVVVQGVERREIEIMRVVQDMLNELNIKSQREYRILDYRVDLIIPEKGLVIEFDEYHHAYNQDADKIRQNEIESLGFKFIRLKEGESIGVMVAKIVRVICSID
jgi:very-short-patch-repair endonuclease